MSINNRDFWIFRLGQALSELGDICGTVAISWWLLEKTGSGLILAAVVAPMTFFRMLMTVLLGPVADRMAKKNLALVADLVRGSLWAILGFLSLQSDFYLLAIILTYAMTSIGSALFSAVITPMLFELSGSGHRTEAMRVAQILTSSSTLIGAICGGALVTVVGYKSVLFLNAVTFFVATIATWMIKMTPHPVLDTQVKTKVIDKWRTWISDIVEGGRYIMRNGTLRTLGVVFLGVEFLLAPSAVILPVIIKMEHQGPAWYLGTTYAIQSMGSLACLMIFKHLQKRVSQDFWILHGLIVTMGLGYFCFAVTSTPFTAFAGALLLGGSLSGVQVILIPKIGRIIDPSFQARAFTVLSFLAEIGTPLGIASTGLLMKATKVNYICFGIATVFVLYSFSIRLIPNEQDFWKRDDERRDN